MTVRHRSVVCKKLCPISEGAAVRRASSAHGAACQQQPPSRSLVGISAAFLIGYLGEHRPAPDAPPEGHTTRAAASGLNRRRREAGEAGAYADTLTEERHFVTGGPLVGRAEIHVAHAWDASFESLVDCLAEDAEGEMDRPYAVDVFTLDPATPPADPVAEVQQAVAAAREVLLVLDAEACALGRLWVLFEALLAAGSGKLRVRCSAPGGFGASEAALDAWEAHIDRADWVLAAATRKADERRLRAFAERSWEASGRGLEQRLAQLKKLLRREAYGQILLGAVGRGDLRAARAALDRGASPEHRDAHGNTAEELAAYAGHAELEELLFTRRMQALPHQRLSAFFEPSELLAASAAAHPDVLAPFLTEAEGEAGEDEGGPAAGCGGAAAASMVDGPWRGGQPRWSVGALEGVVSF